MKKKSYIALIIMNDLLLWRIGKGLLKFETFFTRGIKLPSAAHNIGLYKQYTVIWRRKSDIYNTVLMILAVGLHYDFSRRITRVKNIIAF